MLYSVPQAAVHTNKIMSQYFPLHRRNLLHKLSLYADDLLLFISEAHTSIPSALDVISNFSNVPGYKMTSQRAYFSQLSRQLSI